MAQAVRRDLPAEIFFPSDGAGVEVARPLLRRVPGEGAVPGLRPRATSSTVCGEGPQSASGGACPSRRGRPATHRGPCQRAVARCWGTRSGTAQCGEELTSVTGRVKQGGLISRGCLVTLGFPAARLRPLTLVRPLEVVVRVQAWP